MKVFIASADNLTKKMFLRNGWDVLPYLNNPDLVCFTGGADVHPQLYREALHPRTFCDSYRDTSDSQVFNICIENDIPMVGICRGGQFLNVMSGGRMYQDCDGHTSSHSIKDILTGSEIFSSSTHHQMMRPSNTADIIAIAQEAFRKEYMGEDGKVVLIDSIDDDDVEVCYYKATRSLCFQPHPEFDGFEELENYFFDLITCYLI